MPRASAGIAASVAASGTTVPGRRGRYAFPPMPSFRLFKASLLLVPLVLIGCKSAGTIVPPETLSGGTYRLDPSGQWVPADPGELSSDEAAINQARALLTAGDARGAQRILDRWITDNEHTDSRLLPRAILLRGDAELAGGDEFAALHDYERIAKEFPGTPEFAKAVERELEIAIRYVHGLKRRLFGLRMADAYDIGVELLVRVQERMPGSDLAERAAIELADYYYRIRDLSAASDAYEIFVVNHPHSVHAPRAHQRRIYANIARFGGPRYDASGLTEASVLIEEYAAIDPIGAQRAGLTDALIARLEESAASQRLDKANWYLIRGDLVSARFVLQRLIRTYPRTVSADVALQMLEQRGWSVKEH